MTETAYELIAEDLVEAWAGEADVLVVGFGAAGSCAATPREGASPKETGNQSRTVL